MARFYALLTDAEPLAPYDEVKVGSYFGFSEAHIPQLGHRLLPVSVVFAKVRGGPITGKNAEIAVILLAGGLATMPNRRYRASSSEKRDDQESVAKS